MKKAEELNNIFAAAAKRTAVENIPIEDIEDFYIDGYGYQPFKVEKDAEFENLVKDISEHGVYMPAIVRRHPDNIYKYQMLAGHRRKLACSMAGMDTIPCMVGEFNDEEAVHVMVTTNLTSRERILPSEKAFAYKMELEAIKKQGNRSDLTGEKPISSQEYLARQVGEGHTTLHNYIRLTHLTPELLKLVDDGKMALKPAVEISYAGKAEQETILSVIEETGAFPSFSQAKELRRLSEGQGLTYSIAESMLLTEKPNQKEMYSLPLETITRHFSTSKKEVINRKVNEALNIYTELAKPDNAAVREALAKSSTSAETLRLLAGDKSAKVREQVAKNPNTPSDVKRELKNDKEASVRNACLKQKEREER